MKKFFCLSGMARSGSTVLASLLNQHPEVYVSGTSPLLDLIVHTNIKWDELKHTYVEEHPEQINNVYTHMVQSFYKHIEKPIVIDKHRGWPKNIKGLATIGMGDTKIICTYRPVAEIIASFIKLTNKNPNNAINAGLKKLNKKITLENQCDFVWNHFIIDNFDSVRSGLQEAKKNIILVSYDEIVNHPNTTLSKVYDFLEIDHFNDHDFLNIKNINKENDAGFWNLPGLHDINPVLKSDGKTPEEIIGKDLTKFFSRFDLNPKDYE